jgi:predicted outer membrane repeat protein
MDHSAIRNNLSNANGAGIFVDNGNLDISTSFIRENSTTSSGGGVYNHGGAVVITNTTFTTNTAILGGGYFANAGVVNLAHTTFSGNSAPSGGGLYVNSAATVSLVNSIVANSSPGNECFNVGVFVDGGYNIVEDGTCISAGTSFPGDPLLTPLRDNGGPLVNGFPLFTYAFLPGSLAYNAIPAGVNGCGTTYTNDQRDAGRSLNGACDIGAYEQDAMIYLPLIIR